MRIKNILLFTAYSTLLLFFAAEIGLRLNGTYKTYSEKITGRYTSPFESPKNTPWGGFGPDQEFVLDHGEFRFTYQTNRHGFRERDPQPADTAFAIRLVVFGDSFTEGVGVDYAGSWPRVAEGLLRADSLDALVYNYGVSGGDPFYNYRALTGLAGELRPTHVVFALNGTDLSDYTMRGGFSRFRNGRVQYRPAPWYHLLFRFSHVVRYFVIERAGLDYNFQPMADYDAIRAEAADSISVCIKRAAEYCEDRNIRFLAVTHAMPSVLCAMDSLTVMEVDEFRRALNDLPVLHLSPCLAHRLIGPHCRDYAWPVDGHFNEKGYRVMGECFYEEAGEWLMGMGSMVIGP